MYPSNQKQNKQTKFYSKLCVSNEIDGFLLTSQHSNRSKSNINSQNESENIEYTTSTTTITSFKIDEKLANNVQSEQNHEHELNSTSFEPQQQQSLLPSDLLLEQQLHQQQQQQSQPQTLNKPLVSSMAKNKSSAIKMNMQGSHHIAINRPPNYRRHISFDDSCKKPNDDEVRSLDIKKQNSLPQNSEKKIF